MYDKVVCILAVVIMVLSVFNLLKTLGVFKENEMFYNILKFLQRKK